MPTLKTPYIIDVEASGFGPESYPIEIGIALNDDTHYCALIKPHQDWTHWDKTAEAVHGISRQTLLKVGKDIEVVAKEINKILDGKTVYSDAWVVDDPWIIKLFSFANISRSFRMYDIQTIMTETQFEYWDKTKQDVVRDLRLFRHRADNDAQIIQETYIRSLSLSLHKSTSEASLRITGFNGFPPNGA